MIDTNILIDAIRGFEPAGVYLRNQIASGDAVISIISAMELVQGARDTAALRVVRRLLQQVIVLPTTADIAWLGLGLMETFRLSHGLEIEDALIAATALAHGLVLHTRNVRDFQMVADLAITRPY